jgi:hypothetical protein
MIFISVLSGLFSAMYIWADKFSDIRISINDLYMALLMTGFMIFFMAALAGDTIWIVFSLLSIGTTVWLIRTQRYVSKRQYFRGMIPHHSMAVLMSKRLLENDTSLTQHEKQFVDQIIQSQEREIEWMKNKNGKN